MSRILHLLRLTWSTFLCWLLGHRWYCAIVYGDYFVHSCRRFGCPAIRTRHLGSARTVTETQHTWLRQKLAPLYKVAREGEEE